MKRPTTVEEMLKSFKGFATSEGVERGLGFEPRSTDILISPYAKCGTTWVQQIVHSLRTRGAMDFDEITAVTPWLELSHDMGIDPNAQQYFPRAYKSHLSWDLIPKGGRYICVLRDPKDALVSMYKFLEGWFFQPGSISINEFARDFYMREQDADGYWYHLVSWWQVREQSDVLILCYEDMKDNLCANVKKIAAVMSIELDAQLQAIVLEHSSLEFMRRHSAQFDDHLIRQTRDTACGLPPGGVSNKVNRGQVGNYATALEPQLIDELDEIWAQRVYPHLEIKSYSDLRLAMPSL